MTRIDLLSRGKHSLGIPFMELEKMEGGPDANFPRSPRINKTQEDFMKMLSLSKLFIAAALLCMPMSASNAQAPNARGSRISPGRFSNRPSSLRRPSRRGAACCPVSSVSRRSGNHSCPLPLCPRRHRAVRSRRASRIST